MKQNIVNITEINLWRNYVGSAASFINNEI